jgi:UDP-glucose 4-epimerase
LVLNFNFEAKNDMNYLITGGAGFIGSKVAEVLIDKGSNVYILDDLSTGLLGNVHKKAVFIEGDFSLQETIDNLPNIKFDAVFHFGGQSSGENSFIDPERDFQVNTISTLKLLQYCKKVGCKKIIYASSMAVYGEYDNKESFCEADQSNPKSFYAVGKLASEKCVEIFSEKNDIKYTIFRYFNVYGPGQNYNNMSQGMVSIFLRQLLDSDYNKCEVKGSLGRFRDFIYIDDVVKITLEVLNNKHLDNQVVNVGTGVKTTVKDLVDCIKLLSDTSKKVKVLNGTPGDQGGIYSNNQKINNIIKIDFMDIFGGIKKTIEHYRSNYDNSSR